MYAARGGITVTPVLQPQAYERIVQSREAVHLDPASSIDVSSQALERAACVQMHAVGQLLSEPRRGCHLGPELFQSRFMSVAELGGTSDHSAARGQQGLRAK
jgi:hypothetical protein